MTATELLAKYDVPGPRYTSYPTVPYWQRTPTQEQWLTHLGDAITRSRAAGQGGALYMHVPFCRSLCHYCGCNTVITRDTVGHRSVRRERCWRSGSSTSTAWAGCASTRCTSAAARRPT